MGDNQESEPKNKTKILTNDELKDIYNWKMLDDKLSEEYMFLDKEYDLKCKRSLVNDIENLCRCSEIIGIQEGLIISRRHLIRHFNHQKK